MPHDQVCETSTSPEEAMNNQHTSDIEAFAQLTGNEIQPEDDEPILGDEIELEDIEWSL
jgi:hypothetical protein